MDIMALEELLALRINKTLKSKLEEKFPDKQLRNNVIRATLTKLVKGEIVIKSFEIELNT